MNQPVLQRFEKDDYDTPAKLFQDLADRYGPFTLDAAASPANAKCDRFFTKEQDALSQDWAGVVWCNPPWRDLIKWCEKAKQEVDAGRAKRVILLLPASTKTRWFHDYVLPHSKIFWVRGGVKFGGAKDCYIGGVLAAIFEREDTFDGKNERNRVQRRADDRGLVGDNRVR